MQRMVLFYLAERRIEEALRRGLLDDLPRRGKLDIDLMEDVPAELRASYTLLRAAGCIPDELAARRQRLRLRDLLAAATDDAEAAELRRQLRAAELREALARERHDTP